MSVGKAGDIQKWLDAKYHLYLDRYSMDNIENKMDICARYIKTKRKEKCLCIIYSDSSENIKSTKAAKRQRKMVIYPVLTKIENVGRGQCI